MVKINIALMVAIALIAFVAVTGMASAELAVSVDTIQTNGHYIGVPTIIDGETYTYGYNYVLVPDGTTYTITGTATNDQNAPVLFGIGALYIKTHSTLGKTVLTVPAASSSGFSFTVTSYSDMETPDIINRSGHFFTIKSPHEIIIRWSAIRDNFQFGPYWADLSNTNYVDGPEGVHTIDQGPMSDMSVIFNNGVLGNNAMVIHSLNTNADDYKLLYTNGKFDFRGSPLYAFAE